MKQKQKREEEKAKGGGWGNSRVDGESSDAFRTRGQGSVAPTASAFASY